MTKCQDIIGLKQPDVAMMCGWGTVEETSIPVGMCLSILPIPSFGLSHGKSKAKPNLRHYTDTFV